MREWCSKSDLLRLSSPRGTDLDTKPVCVGEFVSIYVKSCVSQDAIAPPSRSPDPSMLIEEGSSLIGGDWKDEGWASRPGQREAAERLRVRSSSLCCFLVWLCVPMNRVNLWLVGDGGSKVWLAEGSH